MGRCEDCKSFLFTCVYSRRCKRCTRRHEELLDEQYQRQVDTHQFLEQLLKSPHIKLCGHWIVDTSSRKMTNRPKKVHNKQLPNTLAVITESDKELDDKDEISLVSQKASDVTPIPVMSQATHDAENHSPNVTKHYRCIVSRIQKVMPREI